MTDDDSRPLAGVTVSARGTQARSRLDAATDDSGCYSLDGVPSDAYLIVATKSGYLRSAHGASDAGSAPVPVPVDGQPKRVDFRLRSGAVLVGTVTDDAGRRMSDVAITLMRRDGPAGPLVQAGRSVRTNDIGEYRAFGLPPGEYYVMARANTPGAGGGQARAVYPPVFSPGVQGVAEALPVRLTAGGTVTADVSWRRSTSVRVEGTVLDAAGSPAPRGSVVLLSRESGGIEVASAAVIGGQFSFDRVPRGTYVAMATLPGTRGGPADGGDLPQTGRAEVSVGDTDVLNAHVTLRRNLTLSGTVVGDDGKPWTNSSARVVVLPVGLGSTGRRRVEAVGEAGRFRLDVPPGDVRVGMVGVPRGFMVRSVRLGGTTIKPGGLASIDDDQQLLLTVTSSVTSVSGRALDGSGRAVAEATVLVFEDEQGTPRVVGRAESAPDGTFRIDGVAPGSYRVIAQRGSEPVETDLQDRLRAAREISLEVGAAVTVVVTVGE